MTSEACSRMPQGVPELVQRTLVRCSEVPREGPVPLSPWGVRIGIYRTSLPVDRGTQNVPRGGRDMSSL